MYLLLALILVPLIEIALFIQVGGLIGLWPTLAIVVATALAGTMLMRTQGFAVWRRAQDSLARNELPVREVFDGLCLLVAGVLLLTPGFFTDAIGLALFVPQVRDLLRTRAIRYARTHGHAEVWVDGVRVDPSQPRQRPPEPAADALDGASVTDADWREVDDGEDAGPPPDSRWRPPGRHSGET